MNLNWRIFSWNLIAGAIILLTGTFLLLNRMGLMETRTLGQFWPLAIVGIGALKLIAWGSSTDRIFGILVMAIGVLLEMHEVGLSRWGISQLWPLFIVAIGIALIWHACTVRRGGVTAISDPDLNFYTFLGGTEREVNSRNLRGGNLVAICGGFEIDLTKAEMEQERVVIHASAFFGGGEIRVPANWEVIVKGLSLFGAYENRTRRVAAVETQPAKKLIVTGSAVFGAVEVRN